MGKDSTQRRCWCGHLERWHSLAGVCRWCARMELRRPQFPARGAKYKNVRLSMSNTVFHRFPEATYPTHQTDVFMDELSNPPLDFMELFEDLGNHLPEFESQWNLMVKLLAQPLPGLTR